VLGVLGAHGLDARVAARVADDDQIRVRRGSAVLFSASRIALHRAWSETTWQIQALRDNPESAREEYDRIEPLRSGRNVLVTHGLATTLRDYRLNTVMEHEIDATMLSPDFDYIALGHFHARRQVADNAWYCGSQEYCSYGEIRDGKGGLLVDLARGTVEPVDLPCTPMVDLGEVECGPLSPRQVGEEIAGRVAGMAPGEEPPMALVTLSGADRKTLQAMDPGVLQEARDRLLDLRIQVKAAGEGTPLTERHDLRGVNYVDLFGEYLRGQNLPERQHRYVLEKGSAVIQQVMDGKGEEDEPR
jgi:hypothetical protein